MELISSYIQRIDLCNDQLQNLGHALNTTVDLLIGSPPSPRVDANVDAPNSPDLALAIDRLETEIQQVLRQFSRLSSEEASAKMNSQTQVRR